MAYLIENRLDDRSETTEVLVDRLVIGRGATAHLRLVDDTVSLEHAEIHVDDHYVVTDLGSITGTYINGQRVQTAILNDGDRIAVGPFLLVVRLATPISALRLELSRVGGSEEPREKKLKSSRVDYAAAYALDRKFLNKPLLSVLLTLGAVLVLASLQGAGRSSVFQPGVLSRAHTLFSDECSQCHQPWHGVSERACKECHAAPVHHKDQAFVPSCFSCHAEHQDRPLLAKVDDRNCVQCHSNLPRKNSVPSVFQRRVTGFPKDHPEFAIPVEPGHKRTRLNVPGARTSDRARIKLNHNVHLKPGLKGPKGAVQLGCPDCHQPKADGQRMTPISYESHCKQCHELGFDDQLPNRTVPHSRPEIVHAYLIRVYAELQDEMIAYPEPARRLPRSTAAARLSPTIMQKVRAGEAHLYGVTCGECHELKPTSLPYPAVEKPEIPEKWLRHARFSHKAHRMLSCTSCHKETARSKQTTDVLLPGIETCRYCHRRPGRATTLQRASAPADCTTCHTYHDKAADTLWDGPFLVEQAGVRKSQKRR